MRNGDVRWFRIISVLCLLLCGAFAGAQEGRFSQRLEWRSNGNALEYKVEIQNTADRRTIVMTTDKTSVSLALPAGAYRYRVHAFDVLGRESTVSEWEPFDILKASHPDIAPITDVPAVSEKDSTLELSVHIGDVTDDTVVELVNTETEKVVRGKLIVSGATAPGMGGSEVKEATHAQFEKVTAGTWTLRVTNPSGLFSESEPISIASKKSGGKSKKKEQPEPVYDGPDLGGEMYALHLEDGEDDNSDDWGYTSGETTLAVGVGWSGFFGADGLSEYSEEDSFSSFNAQIIALPITGESWRLGADLSVQAFRLDLQNEFYDLTMRALVPQVSMVYRHRITQKRSFWQVRAGGGVALLLKESAYRKDAENRGILEDQVFLYPTASGALSLVLMPFKHISLELGAEYTYVFISEMNTGIITPFASLGLRF